MRILRKDNNKVSNVQESSVHFDSENDTLLDNGVWFSDDTEIKSINDQDLSQVF
jgi:hypothetical protein